MKKRYYRIIKEEAGRKHLADQRTPEKLTQDIIKAGNFLYIDLNEGNKGVN